MASTFDWHPDVEDAVLSHVEFATERLDPDRYAQEPAYVSALLARLDGVVYEGPYGYVEFQATIVADRGPGSAEKKWGADFAVTASITQGRRRARKAVLGQAKVGPVERKSERQLERLIKQCQKMHRATNSLIALGVPEAFGDGPTINKVEFETKPHEMRPDSERKRQKINDEIPEFGKPMSFGDYLAYSFIACNHGDSRGQFVQAVGNSRLTRLHVEATNP